VASSHHTHIKEGAAGVPVTLAGFAGGALMLTPVALVAGLRFTTELGALAYALFFTGLRTVPGRWRRSSRCWIH
jgi:hypothetical protein